MSLSTMSTAVITGLHSAEVVHIPHEQWFHHPLPTRKSPFCHVYTSIGVWPRNHCKAFQWLPLACNVPTKVSPEVLATTKPQRAPSCALWVLGTTKPTLLQPDRLSSKTIRTTGWYAKTSLYHQLECSRYCSSEAGAREDKANSKEDEMVLVVLASWPPTWALVIKKLY
jgi:hypothetical protein